MHHYHINNLSVDYGVCPFKIIIMALGHWSLWWLHYWCRSWSFPISHRYPIYRLLDVGISRGDTSPPSPHTHTYTYWDEHLYILYASKELCVLMFNTPIYLWIKIFNIPHFHSLINLDYYLCILFYINKK